MLVFAYVFILIVVINLKKISQGGVATLLRNGIDI